MFADGFLAECRCRSWKPFKNPARKDALELGHWVKSGVDEKEEGGPNYRFLIMLHPDPCCLDYSFSQYNRSSQVYEYTSEDYTSYLQGRLSISSRTKYAEKTLLRRRMVERRD